MTKQVLIGVPSYDGRIGAHLAVALAEAAKIAVQRGIVFHLRFRIYDSIIQRARNDLLWDALSLKVDDLAMIDDDESFDPSLIFRLVAHPVDYVGFPVVRKSGVEGYNVHYSSGSRIPRDLQTGLLMPDSVGTGFVRLSRRAILAAWQSGEPYRSTDGRDCRWVFDIRPKDGELFGEDILLGLRLKTLGIQCYLDDSATISHINGTKKYDGDFAAWLARFYEQTEAGSPTRGAQAKRTPEQGAVA